MNEMNISASVSDCFSWCRAAAFAGFFRHPFLRQIMLYLGVTLFFAILLLIPASEVVQVGLFTLINAVIPYLFMMAPVVLGRGGDSRVIERLLPVKGSEKYAAFMIYFLIVIGLSTYLFPNLAEWIYMKIPSLQTSARMQLVDIQQSSQHNPLVWLQNLLGLLAGMFTCLAVVLHAKSNRVLKGVASVFVVQIATGILGAVYGMVTMFYYGMIDGMNGTKGLHAPKGNGDVTGLINQVFSTENVFVWVILGILAIYVVGAAVYVYRELSPRMPKACREFVSNI